MNMYEAKYRRYITKSQTRFAEEHEIRPLLSAVNSSDHAAAAGVPLFYDNGTLYVDNSDGHTLVIGPTGCKKSRTTVFSTVASIIAAGESAIINDPKGEIYRNTAYKAKEKGMNVFLLNFRNPSKSHSWNPLAQSYKFQKQGKEDEALQCLNDFAECIVAPALKKTTDQYWGTTSKQFLVSLALLLMDSVPSPYFNLTNLIQLCYAENEGYLKNMLGKIDQTSTAAFGLHTVLDLDAEKTKSCIYSTLLSTMSPLVQNKGLLKMLSGNSFDIESICLSPTLIYVVYPDEKDSLNFAVNLFYTQCYETFIAYAAGYPNDKLPIRVNFVLDEFSNLMPISNFDNRISEARSKNIRYFLFLQSYGQLKQKYVECADTILSNCNNWICFSSKDMEFLRKVSDICGREVDYNGIEHDLISPFEMQHLIKKDEAVEVLILKQGLHPFITELPDFSCVDIFKDYKYTSLDSIDMNSNGKFLSFNEWISKINSGDFRFPYALQAA